MKALHFVRVVAQLPGAKRRWGTGYRIRPNRILTSGHVVNGAETLEIELDDAEGEVSRHPVTLLWHGTDDIDAALLSCPPESGSFAASARLVRTPEEGMTSWQSRGLAKARPSGATVGDSLVMLGGDADQGGSHERRLELTVKAPPKEVEDWQGISGAPVFIGARICGVIRTAQTTFSERILAVPTHHFASDPAFLEHCDFADQDRVETLLERMRGLVMDLSGEVLLEVINGLSQASEDHSRISHLVARRDADASHQQKHEATAAIAEVLCNQSLSDVLRVLNEVHKKHLMKGELAHRLSEMQGYLLPLLWDRGMITATTVDPGAALLNLPVATPAMAEILMARNYGRSCRFKAPEDSTEDPVPLASVREFPVTGFDHRDERAFEEFVDQLAAEFVSQAARDKVKRRHGESHHSKMAEIVDDELVWRAEGGDGLRRFFLFDAQFRADYPAFLGLVSQYLPHLDLLEMAGEDEREEWRICRPLRDLLYRQHSRKDGP